MAGFEQAKKTVSSFQVSHDSSDYYYFNDNNPFVGHLQPSGQIVWGSVVAVNASEIHALIDFLKDQAQSVFINTGCHGSVIGNSGADSSRYTHSFFLFEDLRRYIATPLGVINRVGLGTVTTHNHPERPPGANHVIDAWCFSERSRFYGEERFTHFTDKDGYLVPKSHQCTLHPNKIMTNPHYFAVCRKINGDVHYYDFQSIQELKERQTQAGERLRCGFPDCREYIILDHAISNPQLKKEIEDFQARKLRETAEKTERLAEIARLTAKSEQDDTTIAALEGQLDLRDRTITQVTIERDTHRNRAESAEQQRDTFERERNTFRAERDEAQVQVRQQSRELQRQAVRVDRLVFQNDGLLGKDTLDQRIAKSLQQSVKEYRWADLMETMRLQKESADAVLEHTFKGGIVHWMAPIYERRNAFVLDGYESCHEHITRVVADLFLNLRREAVKDQTIFKMAFKSPNPKGGSSQAITFSYQEKQEVLSPLMDELITTKSVANKLVDELRKHNVLITPELDTSRWSTKKEYDRISPKTYEETLTKILGECLRHRVADRFLLIADRV